MSLKYMVAAFNKRVGSPSRKLVLLKLADNANDSGLCWPSIQYIAAETELSPDTVRRQIADLEKTGIVKVNRRTKDGVNLPNTYELIGLHFKQVPPAPCGEGTRTAQGGGTRTMPVPPAPCGEGTRTVQGGGTRTMPPEPINIYKPVSEPPNNKGAQARPNAPRRGGALSVMPKPEKVDEAVWRDFLALRKAKKAPLTETALELIRGEAQKAGISLAEALRVCCARGWVAFQSDWLSPPARGTDAPRVMAPRTVEPNWAKMDYGDAEVQPL